MLQKFKTYLDAKNTELSLHEKAKSEHTDKLLELKKEFDALQEAREVFQKASLLAQNHLALHLSLIVTNALKVIFYENNISFHIKFVERRNSTECDMWLEENNHEYSLLGSRGYGVVDIVSFSLKVAYILLHESDNICIVDEPFRNLHVNKHEVASQMIKELSREIGMQFIISTHVKALKEYADKEFEVTQENEISVCY